jgi:hypothetical protein
VERGTIAATVAAANRGALNVYKDAGRCQWTILWKSARTAVFYEFYEFYASLTREARIGMECWSKRLGLLGAKIPRYSGSINDWPCAAGARPPHRHRTGVC